MKINIVLLILVIFNILNCINAFRFKHPAHEIEDNPEEPSLIDFSVLDEEQLHQGEDNVHIYDDEFQHDHKNSTVTDEQAFISECYKFIYEKVLEASILFKKGFYATTKTVLTKGGSWDLVTDYDKNIEALFIKAITTKFKNHKFIAEESATETHLTDDPTWIIDPIDGTNNYVHGIPFIGISVAMSLKKEIVLGIIYNPILNEMYTTIKGRGAYLNGKKLQTSTISTLDNAVYVHESSFIREDNLREKNAKRTYYFASRAQGFRSLGTAAMTLAYIARGSFDAYIVDDLYPWDVAAGVLLITEAGGCVKNIDGSEFNFIKPYLIAASTTTLCQELVDGIKEADALNFNIH